MRHFVIEHKEIIVKVVEVLYYANNKNISASAIERQHKYGSVYPNILCTKLGLSNVKTHKLDLTPKKSIGGIDNIYHFCNQIFKAIQFLNLTTASADRLDDGRSYTSYKLIEGADELIKNANIDDLIRGSYEIQTKSDDAISELKKWKDKLDLELISQEEYDKKKNELRKYIN